jgi:hypothetical protein
MMRREMLAAVLLLGACVGQAEAQGRPPEAVMRRVMEMDGQCRSAGGRTGDRTGLLQSADLNGDGQPDWVLNEGAYRCEAAESLFGGSGGSAVWVFPGEGPGRVGRPFTNGALSAELENGALWLSVGGVDCGAASVCRRPGVWNTESRGFGLGGAPGPQQVRSAPAPAPAPSAAPRVSASAAHPLVGTWAAVDGRCGDESTQVFQADGRVAYAGETGRWSVSGDTVRVSFNGEVEEDLMEWSGRDRVLLISQEDGYELNLKRCAR